MDQYLENNGEFVAKILSSIGDGIIATDTDFKIVFINEAAKQITGWEDNVEGRSFTDVFRLYHAFTREPIESPLKQVYETGQQRGLPDGTILATFGGVPKYLSATFTQINDNGRVCGVVVAFRDVSNFKLLELKCRNEETNLRMIFNAAPVGMIILNEDNLISDMNDSALAMTGQEKDEVVGKAFGDGFGCKGSDEDLRGCGFGRNCQGCELRRSTSLALEGLASTGFEFQKTFHIDGKLEERWFRASTSPIIVNNRRHVAVALSDISARKKWEHSIIKAQDFYVQLLGKFPALVWRSDINQQWIYVNDGWQVFTGRAAEQILGRGWLDFVHPKDRENYFSDANEGLNQQSGNELEIRLLHRSGQYRWLYCINRPFYDIDGNFDGFVGMGMDITDRKNAEEARRVNEEKYRQLFNGAQDAIFLTEETNGIRGFKEVNDIACQSLGYSRQEMLSMSTLEITPPELHDVIKIARKQLDAIGHVLVESKHLTKDGKEIPVEINGHVFELHGKKVWLSIARDITERKKAEQLLEESRSRYRSLFVNMHSGFCYSHVLLNDDGIPMDFEVLEANDAFAKLFVSEGEEIIGKKFSEIFCQRWPAYPENVATFIEITDGKKDKVQWEYQSAVSGRWFSVTAYTPKKNRLALLCSDITSHKEAEAELRRAKDAAEAANRSKSEFLANMSHEIRTPINGMMGMIDLTLLSELTDDQRDNLYTAKTCAKSLLALINDILDFSKMEVGKLSVEALPFNLREFAAEVIKNYTHLAISKGLALSCEIAADVPDNIYGDTNRLRQVFNNLIYNALKFTETGSVKLTVKVQENVPKHLVLLFAVSDTGIGIASKDMGKLFKSFSQVDGSITRRYGGTGLGLAICKQLVEMMDGKIWAKSETGKGSTFYFTIRTTAAGSSTRQQSSTPVVTNGPKDVSILVVEDDEINRTVIKRLLEKVGYKVVTATDGKEALNRVVAGSFDIILMDIQMPGMDGIETTKRIRNMPDGVRRKTPIIALTAYALAGDKERFIEAGMDEYIAKPIQMDELVDKIARITNVEKKISGPNLALKLNEKGNVTTVTQVDKKTIDKGAVNSIAEIVSRMSGSTDADVLEQLAHTIKDIANKNDLDDIKSIAFKAELAARRENLKEVSAHVDHLRKICSTSGETGSTLKEGKA